MLDYTAVPIWLLLASLVVWAFALVGMLTVGRRLRTLWQKKP